MKKYLILVGLLLSSIFSFNVSAETDYVDNETPAMEQKEEEMVEDDMPVQPPSRAGRAVSLTVPTEGVYDKIVDTHNSAGVMTERKYYYKGVLVEKRTYTKTGSTDCRMKNKYLYYSNGSTVYIHRTYSNTGSTCYNLQTKRYGTSSQIQAHSIYEGKVNGLVKENRYYETTGTYYTSKVFYNTSKVFYNKGKATSKEYWLGKSGNYITHIANYNSAGTEWIKATYYYNSAKKIK